MSAWKHRVRLTPRERRILLDVIHSGRQSAPTAVRALILLNADQNGSNLFGWWTDARIAAALHVGIATVGRVRQRYAEGGLRRAPFDWGIGTLPGDREAIHAHEKW